MVEGQVTASGVEGQVTTGGFEGQEPQGTTDVLGGVEDQPTDNDVEGQDNDARPYSESRPTFGTQAPMRPGYNATVQGVLPPSTRRVGGSVKR